MRTPTLLVFSAIDNLVKGAAGQAIQNANLMFGLDETAGLHACNFRPDRRKAWRSHAERSVTGELRSRRCGHRTAAGW
jgi:hypothetical protein